VTRRLLCLILLLSWPAAALAESAPFDLAGPTLTVKVTHAGSTLPVSEVPNLAVGDQLTIRAELPPGQSVHYLLVAAFLRGATNPPPTSWFHKAETWDRKTGGGLTITVPADAQQLLVFLAPQTGGDFATLVNAVRGKPGAFVRASQDLNQASLDRSRLDAFLAAIRAGGPSNPDRLKTVTPLLARSLTIKLNTDCFDKMAELQAACLAQGQDALVLSDGHSASIVEALTNGSTADLAFQLSATPHADFGLYSPYIAAVMDIARLLDSLHTAKYQYIPALATERGERMQLVLNTAPSFHDPLSVLVAALPAIEPPQPPPLSPVDPKATYCAERTDLVLPVDGAPLVYSTGYAHDMTLRLKTKDGHTVDLPVTADAEKGGFVVAAKGFDPAQFGDDVDGTLHGDWGFQSFDGPEFHLQTSRPAPWRLASGDDQALVVGRDDAVRLEGEAADCVESVALVRGAAPPTTLEWKPERPDAIAVTVPLTGESPGVLTLLVKQYGAGDADQVPIKAFAQAGKLDSFTFHAGDASGLLKGTRLDQVTGLTVDGVTFKPGVLSTEHGGDELAMEMVDPAGAEKLPPGAAVTAKVALADGRTPPLKLTVAGPSPSVALIGKSVQPAAAESPIEIRLNGPDEVRQGAVLSFSVRARRPAAFSPQETIEVASADGSASTTLSLSDGLTLEDSRVAVARLDTAKAFGPSAFGPLRYRVIDDGDAGPWQPLATLVRTPALKALKCREAGGCDIEGSNLFLIDQLAGDPSFNRPVKVPEGFPGFTLSVPHPTAGHLYVRLRDDPGVINELWFPAGRRGG
jgi:hypothetical protein